MKTPALLLSLALLTPAAWSQDVDAIQRATQAGCLACHAVESGARNANGLPSIGPAFDAVAARYKSLKGAQQQLTAAVMGGTGVQAPHWQGQLGSMAMPPNRVALSEAEAAQIVAWILSIEPLVHN
jgi:cytochrome c